MSWSWCSLIVLIDGVTNVDKFHFPVKTTSQFELKFCNLGPLPDGEGKKSLKSRQIGKIAWK